MISKLDDIAKPMPRGKRRLLATLAVAVLLAASYAGYWFHLAGKMRTQVEAQTASLIEQGYEARYQTLTITGFPGEIVITLNGLSLADGNGWSMGAQRLTGRLSPLNPTHARIGFEGDLRAVLPLLGRPRVFDGVADAFFANLSFGGKTTLWQGDVRIENLEMVETKTGDRLGVSYLKAQAQANIAPDPSAQQSAYDLLIRADSATLPKRLSSPWGNKISEAALEASLMGRIPKARSIEEALATWRDMGGTAQILRANLNQGPVKLATDGTMALDHDLQPVGRAIARVSGYLEIIDALVDHGVMRSRDAPLAKMVLGALAKRPNGGGRSVLNVPLTLKHQTLYAGPIALTKIDPVKWDFLKNLL